jgi:alpha-beta hydrolase superfamily lysophospholipase
MPPGESTSDTRTEEVEVSLSGVSAAGTVHMPASDPAGTVVFFHGRGGARKRHQPAAARVAAMGFVCVTYDFRGCGETEGSAGELTLSDWIADAQSGVDWTMGQSDFPPPYGCYGSSFGAYLAARTARRRPLTSLVLRVPSAYPTEYLDKSQEEVDRNRDEIWDYRSGPRVFGDPVIRGMKDYRGDVLIIGAGLDDEVPRETTEAYGQAATAARSARLVWLPDATHNMNEEPAKSAYIELMSRWFTETLSR